MQLIIVLYRLGSSGEGATISKIASLFGVSEGGVINVNFSINYAVISVYLHNIGHKILWCNSEAKKQVHALTKCSRAQSVGYVDGTEIKWLKNLLKIQKNIYPENMYKTKTKSSCVSGHNLLIRHIVLGYPGSVHDF